jgi:hypothetical protein
MFLYHQNITKKYGKVWKSMEKYGKKNGYDKSQNNSTKKDKNVAFFA